MLQVGTGKSTAAWIGMRVFGNTGAEYMWDIHGIVPPWHT